MLPLAAQNAAPKLAPPLPARRPAPKAAPRLRPRVPVAHVLLFVTGWLLVVGAALLLLSRFDAINRLTDANDRARQELARVTATNQTLQQRVDELSSLDRIQKLATEKLHMVLPGKVAVAHVDPAYLAQRPAPSLAALDASRQVAQAGFWHQVTSWWRAWRGGSGVAEGR